MGWFGEEFNKETTVFTTSWTDCTERKVSPYYLILMREEGHQLSALGLDGARRGIHCNNLEGDSHVSGVTDKSDGCWSRNTAQVTCIEGSWGNKYPDLTLLPPPVFSQHCTLAESSPTESQRADGSVMHMGQCLGVQSMMEKGAERN